MAFRLGSIEPFDAGTGDWSTYKARLEQFLVANDVEGEPKQVATVLTLIGGPTYGLLVNLLAPEEPAKQKLADIFATLDGHFAPKPLVIAERYRFNKRDQRPGEPLNDYVAELRRLARHCEFGSNLNEHLRDRLVCGLNNPATIRKLLAEANLDLKKAIHIAHATETAARDANELHKETPVPTHQLRAQSAKFKGRYQTHGHGSKPCYRCGGTDHRQEDCPHKNSTCDYCRKTGHIDAACRKKRADQPDSTAPSSRSTQTKPTSRHTPRSAARAHNLEAEDYSEDEFFIHHNEQDTEHKRTEIWIEPSINGRSLKMELDTGSALSIIPLRLYSAHFADLELSPSSVVLKTYTGERVRPTGALDVTVECNEQKVQAQLLVVDTCGPPLFGRDWLKLIRIDWPRVFRVEKVKREEEPPIKQAENLTPATKVKLEALLDKYADIFGEDRGKLRTGKGHLQLRDDAVPKFCKARPLPYALRSKVAEELSRLESDGIISPVSWSDWATPIVPIVKKDGSVRVCGDFKVTVNPQLNVEQYPLPRIDDVFASLAGGKRFSKIDLKQAYLQMEMDDESSALLTLNTHKGLFKLNRLAFGVASAPALWQRSMDQILQGIPYTQCILDDIIVTGEDDAEHLRNLETVFRRLSEAGLRVNRLKCNFFQEHVEYCGHGVSARGLHKTPAKIDAISDARCPVNVTELRSFLGLVNYYARFLPNLATTLHPLNELLQKGVEWRWTADCTTAFDTVKAQIASDLVLTHFDSALPVRVASDASPYGLGAVLSHVMPTGEERPIAFASRTLSVAEKNYSQIDKEALGIVWSIKKFHTYLYGRPFTLITDHQPLTAIFHPATNGLAERFVQTFKTAMKSGDETVSLNTRLQQFLLCYRSTPHATTKASPSELLYNRSLRTRLDLLRPSTRAVVQSRQLDQAGRNPLQPARALPVGASVMVRDYRSGYPSWIAARITDQQGLHYQVETYPGVCWRRHIDQIRPAAAPLPEPPQSADWSHSTEAPATTETSQAGGRTEAATVTEHQVMPAVTTQTRVAEPDVIEPARRYPLRVRKTPERLNLWTWSFEHFIVGFTYTLLLFGQLQI